MQTVLVRLFSGEMTTAQRVGDAISYHPHTIAARIDATGQDIIAYLADDQAADGTYVQCYKKDIPDLEIKYALAFIARHVPYGGVIYGRCERANGYGTRQFVCLACDLSHPGEIINLTPAIARATRQKFNRETGCLVTQDSLDGLVCHLSVAIHNVSGAYSLRRY